ncbi:hypothetical protein BHE74_00052714 [Ensete ventricosum]|nr:hypothetical protein BHE74_00052714 [Ensete ventricosum]
MDFGGVLGMDALVGASSEGGGSLCSSSSTTSLAPSDTELGRQGGLRGSILQKHDRPAAEPEDCDWRSLKMARPEELVTTPIKAAPFLLRSNSHPLFPDGEQMLSFSSASPPSSTQCYLGNEDIFVTFVFPVSGSSPGSSNASMQGVMARLRGPFTPSQWLELEHQALIYKYLVANVPIPATLLIPIRRILGASGFPPLSARSFGSGYSGNADPEPGRCRRTDGKKWRCSRDAVADQKYCERHMNRGRHRSRKHVENQTGNATKAMPTTASSQSAAAVLGGASTNTLTISMQQSKSLQSNTTDPCPLQFNSKGDQNACSLNSKSLSTASPVNQKPDSDVLPPVSDQHNPFEETSSRAEFGLVSPDSLLNPPSILFSNNIDFMATPKLNEWQIQSHPFNFIDDWPKTQSNRSTITWPEVDKTQSDRTQLSMSIPKAYSDFSSSSCNHDKPALSLPKLSREYDAIRMPSWQANWKLIPWEASMAGPLGEVLTSTKSTPKDQSKNRSSSSLNLLTDGWDSRLESSPAGVLHKTSFGSLSNSTGSSPSAENSKTHDRIGSLCSGLLGSTVVKAPTIQSL